MSDKEISISNRFYDTTTDIFNTLTGYTVGDVDVDENAFKWIPITEKLPPIGTCVIVTVKDHYRHQLELRYPVWYIEKPYERGYAFYFGDMNNMLLPDISEVIAWMPIPNPYEPDNLDWSEKNE